jgi:hypothetical protein
MVMTTTKVFIAGSRNIFELTDIIKHRIDNIIAKNFKVIVGDANGADRAVQDYLSMKNYKNVEVFCMDGWCRNNVGNWPVRNISAMNARRKDFAYYSTKDRAMSKEADHGFMLWDGRSRGTLRNVMHLVHSGTPVLLYMSLDKSFHALRRHEDLAEILDRYNLSGLSIRIESIEKEWG